jgi:hypothetical protein
MSNAAIWKALTNSGIKFPKNPVKKTFDVRLRKLVKDNVLETKSGRYYIKKEYLKKWIKSLEKMESPKPPKVISKSKASMKKGATKKIQTKKNAKKTAKRSSAKKSADKKKAESKKRALIKKRSKAKKATK